MEDWRLHQQPSYLLPLHHHRLRQRVVAPLLVGESLQVVQLRLQLDDEVLLLLPLGRQTFPLLPFSLEGSHKRQKRTYGQQREFRTHTPAVTAQI